MPTVPVTKVSLHPLNFNSFDISIVPFSGKGSLLCRRWDSPPPMVPDEPVHVRRSEPYRPPELDGRKGARSGQGVDVGEAQSQFPPHIPRAEQVLFFAELQSLHPLSILLGIFYIIPFLLCP